MDPPKRHCWECLRRCLVCDSADPECRRCSASGLTCPGYGGAKPVRLRWLAPGRVVSQSRRKGKAVIPARDENDGVSTEAATTKGAVVPAYDVLRPRFKLTTDTCALFEAAEYYNLCIHPDLIPIHELGSNPHIYPLLPMHLKNSGAYPDHLRLSLVCMTISHRVNRLRGVAQHSVLVEKFYRYRGSVLRSLCADIGVERKQTGDIVMASVMTLLLADNQHGASPNWRWHLEVLQRLITLRGGVSVLGRSPGLAALLRCFILVGVIGNTTTPASDEIMTDWHLDNLGFTIQQSDQGPTSFQMCPSPIFAEIIRINHLRLRASHGVEGLTQEACEILSRIDAFSPETWIDCKPSSKEEWLLVARICQAAVAIYCISSLQSFLVLPNRGTLRYHCVAQGQCLQGLLPLALGNIKTKRFMLWPLVVLGVEAANAPAMRDFVEKQLPEVGRHTGTWAPMAARQVLQRFWASGKTDWDGCFDRPYVFLTQTAVDLSGIPPE